ncbi:MAG: hypothetical protein IT384_30500 [Deltaproteobacteria bacterium]|nr:hypothetical protein [Deltaproteobacteria bacterium]
MATTTESSAAQGLLAVVHLSQLARMARGDQLQMLAEFVGKYPDPNAVSSDFVPNLLAVSRTYMRGAERAGVTLPEGLTQWRQAALDRYERELPVRTWRLLAKSDELPAIKALQAAKARGGAEYQAMVDRVRAITRLFSDSHIVDLINVSDYASDLPGGDLYAKYLKQDPDISQLMERVKRALDFVGQADWRELDYLISLQKLSEQIASKLEADAESARLKSGAKAYGQDNTADARASRTGGRLAPQVAIRIRR